ncbi:MAG TPA: HAD family phosphatase [Candidatus Udaeobacter sp.]|jgi:HAD superfamily hydrolase (TIGR01509 family)|nr:HAD family phosphatase [Candidatus Udaeobacter sp.]
MHYTMRSPFHAVIFDLDGVLADSEPWWNQIDTKLLAEHEVSYHGEYHRNVLGVSYRIAVEFYKNAFHISASVEELMRRRGEIATDFFANRVGLFPSAKTTLEQLREMKLHLAVATSSLSASARPFLDRTGIKRLFRVVVTGDEVQQGKPHPEIYLRVAEKLGILPEVCLVVEDSHAGVAAGKAADMRVAAIPDTRFVDPREYEMKADYLLESLLEIPDLICRANAAANEKHAVR